VSVSHLILSVSHLIYNSIISSKPFQTSSYEIFKILGRKLYDPYLPANFTRNFNITDHGMVHFNFALKLFTCIQNSQAVKKCVALGKKDA